MNCGKVKIEYKFIISAAIASLFCPVFAYEVPLPNPAMFEPASFTASAKINTQTANPPETRIVPAAEVPIPEVMNSFFAPTTDITNAEPKLTSKTVLNQENPFNSMNNVASPSQYRNAIVKIRANSYSNENKPLETNPFKVMNNITLPSQYKKPAKQSKSTEEVIKTLPQISEKEVKTPADSYISSVIEEIVPHEIDYEGKTISQIQFSGLLTIREDVVARLLNVQENSIFNFHLLQENLEKIYTLGYFTDSMYVEPELLDDGTVKITFVLEENMKVKNVDIKGNNEIPSSEIMPLIKNLEGLPQNLNLINEAIEKINKYYEEKGYILAKVSNVDDNAEGNLTFTISEGIIDEINFKGNEITKDYVIKRNILTQAGSVYNEELFKKDLSKVYSTQIFEQVDRKIEPCPDKEGRYIVTVEVKEASSNSVSIGVGLDNALGGFGSLSYNEKNLFGRNQKLSLSGMLGSGLLLSDASIKNRMNWNIELNFFEPYLFSENNTFASKIYYRDLGSYQIPLAIEQRFGITNTIAHKVRGYDNLTTSLAFGYEYIHLKEGDLGKIAQVYRDSGVDFSKRREQLIGGSFLNIAPGIRYSTLDNENMPREGLEAKANFMEAIGLNSTKRSNGRLIGAVNKYIPFAKKSTLLIGAKGGVKVHGHDMPEVMAFRLGGPYTIRGFKMNGVGTGESFIMATGEIQTPIPLLDRCKYDVIKNLRFAFFMDAGRIFDPTITSKLYDRPLSAITMGVGLRIHIPGMNTISVDYGLPLTHTGRYASNHGYFTFGTGGLYDSY